MMNMSATELFLMYREYRLLLPHSGLPPCYRDHPQPYEHFLMAWQATRTQADRDAPRTPTPEAL